MIEKQPLNIDEIVYQWIVRKINLCSFETSKGTSVTIDNVQKIISKHIKEFLDDLPQESTYEKTTVPNVLLYESWYKEWLERWRQIGNKEWWKLGREDIKKETLKLKKLREKTLRKRKWCSYEEEWCMLTIINDLETLLSPTDTK